MKSVIVRRALKTTHTKGVAQLPPYTHPIPNPLTMV